MKLIQLSTYTTCHPKLPGLLSVLKQLIIHSKAHGLVNTQWVYRESHLVNAASMQKVQCSRKCLLFVWDNNGVEVVVVGWHVTRALISHSYRLSLILTTVSDAEMLSAKCPLWHLQLAHWSNCWHLTALNIIQGSAEFPICSWAAMWLNFRVQHELKSFGFPVAMLTHISAQYAIQFTTLQVKMRSMS